MSLKLRGLSLKAKDLLFERGFNWSLLLKVPAELVGELDWASASLHADIAFIAKYASRFPWRWRVVSRRSDLAWTAIRRLDLPWCYATLSAREFVDFAFVRERLYQLTSGAAPNTLRSLPEYARVLGEHTEALGMARGKAAALAHMAAKFQPDCLAWDYARLSEQDGLPLDLVAEAAWLPWDWSALFGHKDFSYEFADLHRLPLDPMQSPLEFEPEHVDQFPHIQWDLDSVALLVDIEFVERHPGLLSCRQLSAARWNMTPLFENDPWADWDFRRLSGNAHLRAAHLASRLDADWDWRRLTMSVPLREIASTISAPDGGLAERWHLAELCERPDMNRFVFLELALATDSSFRWPWGDLDRQTWFHNSLVFQLPDRPWNFRRIVEHGCDANELDMFIRTFAEKLHDANLQTLTELVSAELVMSLPELRWDWEYVARNYVLTNLDVERLGDRLKPELLLLNPNYIDDLSAVNASEMGALTNMLDQV